jgi:2-methylisocitrate lyase-like PEP mutase family enzyme
VTTVNPAEPGRPGQPAGSGGAAALRALHHGPHVLVLPNVWDPVSARAFAAAGFAALATSSSAVAATLGYADGQTPAAEMLGAVTRIAGSVPVPVTVDIENGYGLPPAELVARLLAAGIAGCNLEDSDPVTRTLTEPARQADFLAAVRAAAGGDLVLNARVDVFIRPGAADEAAAIRDALQRAGRYLAAGADCTYPIVAPASALPELVRGIAGPVNAMYRPGGPSVAELAALGVARISFGGGLHARATEAVRELAGAIAAEQAALGDR